MQETTFKHRSARPERLTGDMLRPMNELHWVGLFRIQRPVQVQADWQNGLCLCIVCAASAIISPWVVFFQLVAQVATGCSVLVGNVSARTYILHLVGHCCTHGADIFVAGFALSAWLTTQEAEQVP